jgi:hypothetical protein
MPKTSRKKPAAETMKNSPPPAESGKVIQFPQVQKQTGWTAERRQYVRRLSDDVIGFIDEEGMSGIVLSLSAHLQAYNRRRGRETKTAHARSRKQI